MADLSRFRPKRVARFMILCLLFLPYCACYLGSRATEVLDTFISRLSRWARPELYAPRRGGPIRLHETERGLEYDADLLRRNDED